MKTKNNILNLLSIPALMRLVVLFAISFYCTALAGETDNTPTPPKGFVGNVPPADSVKFYDLDHGWMVHGYLKGKLVYMVHKLEKGAKADKVTNEGQTPIDVQDTIIIHKIKQKE